jgi:hypothetical protein
MSKSSFTRNSYFYECFSCDKNNLLILSESFETIVPVIGQFPFLDT